MTASTKTENTIPDRLIRAVCARLAANKRVRRTLPLRGRLHIDRQLPFLVVYRRPVVGVDEGTYRLVTSEASYVFASGVQSLHAGFASLVRSVAATLSDEFGAFLVLEISSGMFSSSGSSVEASRPAFRLTIPKAPELDAFADFTERILSGIRVRKLKASVECARRDRTGPRNLKRLVSQQDAKDLNVTTVGLEVKPIYQDEEHQTHYPLVLRELERELTRALRHVFFRFARSHTTHRPHHYHGLGRRAVVKAVWEVDRRLTAITSGFDFLLQVTPVNPQRAWRRFVKLERSQAPLFRYRPLPVDPVRLQRQLYAIPIDRLEDPALREIFREKQLEIGRRLTMLLDLNTPRFVHGSLQLYGEINDSLVHSAMELLESLPSPDAQRHSRVSPAEIARQAEAELEYYRAQWPDMAGAVHVRSDTMGLMVSRGSLLISQHAKIPRHRLKPLLQHEVGTHMVTYFNGRAQPFSQLASGLAGYEALQEGLAVFAEYLVGGLTAHRLRVLAARVIAVHRMVMKTPFVATYRELMDTCGLDSKAAFTTALRVYRGGGLTKDAIYLKGLFELLQYLESGGRFESLFVGKMSVEHVPIIEELQWRDVLRPVPLRPKYLSHPKADERLAAARKGLTPAELVTGVRA